MDAVDPFDIAYPIPADDADRIRGVMDREPVARVGDPSTPGRMYTADWLADGTVLTVWNAVSHVPERAQDRIDNLPDHLIPRSREILPETDDTARYNELLDEHGVEDDGNELFAMVLRNTGTAHGRNVAETMFEQWGGDSVIVAQEAPVKSWGRRVEEAVTRYGEPETAATAALREIVPLLDGLLAHGIAPAVEDMGVNVHYYARDDGETPLFSGIGGTGTYYPPPRLEDAEPSAFHASQPYRNAVDSAARIVTGQRYGSEDLKDQLSGAVAEDSAVLDAEAYDEDDRWIIMPETVDMAAVGTAKKAGLIDRVYERVLPARGD